MVDTSSLFLHVLAAMGIVSGGVVQILAGARLRSANSCGEVVQWARFTRTGGLVVLGSAAVSLLTGGHLAGAVWTTEQASGFSYPFITLGALGLLLLAPIGPMVGGARLRRLVTAAETDPSGPAPNSLLAAVRSPGLWGPIHSLLGVAIGLVALMVYKPSWAVGVVVLLAMFAIGWAGGMLAAGTSARR